MIVMGIDPDKGWAIADHGRPKEDRILGAGSVHGLHEMFALLRELVNDPGLYIDEVRIEKPANKHAYHCPGQIVAAMKSIAVSVGEKLDKGDAIYFFCLGLGLTAVRTAPIKNGTKMSAKQIEGLTNWRAKTNEHARDAIIIAWIERNPQPEEFKPARRKQAAKNEKRCLHV